MGEESGIADYFVVAGLPNQPEALTEVSDKSHLKSSQCMDPITDITVIFPSLDEKCPKGYTFLHKTPTGGLADLNHGSLNSPEVYICYRRGRDKPPLVDIGVLYECKERVLDECCVVEKTPYGRVANVNNTAARTFLTYRRAPKDMPANELVVNDICVINESKLEKPPHAFCPIRKNLNKGMFSSTMYLCYKKSVYRANLLSYKPGLFCRYPTTDRPDWGLPPEVTLFCMPMGASIELWPPQASQPALLFSTFVLTVSDAAEKVYGSAVTFYERYPVEKLTTEQLLALKSSVILSDKKGNKTVEQVKELVASGYTINVNKCICILSHWPFFDCFQKYLYFLYEMSQNQAPSPVPIERYISHLIENVPLPTQSIPRIQIQLSPEFDSDIILTLFEELTLPRSGAGFLELLEALSVEDILLVLLLVLTEQKLLVHSLRANVLTSVVEAISMIVYPFKWQCPYIPLCPLGLAEVLHAPLPYLIGVDSRFFDLYEPPPDVTCVDLDTNIITMPEDKRHLTFKLLPRRASKILRYSLEMLAQKTSDCRKAKSSGKDEYQITNKEQKLELEIREAFLRFMASVLKGYRSFLKPITKAPTIGTTDTNSLFDLQGFLKSRDRNHVKFYQMLSLTQMFIRFIEERSFVSDMDAGLTFFDECTDKEDVDDYNVRLLDFDDSHKSDRTALILPPEPSAEGTIYTYERFELDMKLFGPSRAVQDSLKIPSIASWNLENGANSNTTDGLSAIVAPGSPMARRTKHEVKSARKFARLQQKRAGSHWARCLLTTCYSIWFIHLPSYVLSNSEKASHYLNLAYDVLVKLHKVKLHPTDEVCYRVMMQLCGIHGQPATAVKLLYQMRQSGIQPNALTYGYYNRAVLEAKWPQEIEKPSRLHWKKLRNVILGVAQFRRLSDERDKGVTARGTLLDGSTSSLASLGFGSGFEKTSRFSTILKPTSGLSRDFANQQLLHGPAGILMPAYKTLNDDQTCKARRRSSCSEYSSLIKQSATSMRRGSVSPTTVLQFSDSYASDASILEKHNRLRKDPELNKTPSKSLSVTRESSESLDQSVGDGDSLREREETPTRKIFSKLSSRFGSDFWRTSLDSFNSDASLQEESSMRKQLNGMPPWTSQEALSTERVHIDQRAASESIEANPRLVVGNGSLNLGGSEENMSSSKSDSIRASSEDSNGSCSVQIDVHPPKSPKSPKKISPVRTPVLENDPLRALDNDNDSIENENEQTITNSMEAKKMLLLNGLKEWSWSDSRDRILGSMGSAAAAFESKETNIHRSLTLPPTSASLPLPTVISSPSFPFKLSFSRMGSGRYLKKGDLKFPKTLESAFSGPKSTEIISSVKSAASLVAKKFEEVISTNTTPIKSLNQSSDFPCDEAECGRTETRAGSLDGNSTLWGSNIKKELFGGGGDDSRKSSTSLYTDDMPSDRIIHDTLYGDCSAVLIQNGHIGTNAIDAAVTLAMTTCCRCTTCSTILHDEEIVAGWTWDDSNLNTQCHFCGKTTLPILTVTIYDNRACEKSSTEDVSGFNGVLGNRRLGSLSDVMRNSRHELSRPEAKILDPIIVPYLNPLVLRKELENILQNKGDFSLTQPRFVDKHPIIYWNMVWVFERIAAPSHLANLVLKSDVLSKEQIHPSWEGKELLKTSVVCLWSNPRLLEEVGLPLYILKQQKEKQSTLCDALTDSSRVSIKVLEEIVSNLKTLNVKDSMKLLIRERQRQSKKFRSRSMYREMVDLFLSECTRSISDLDKFDREYTNAYKCLLGEGEILKKCDKPPVSASFRNYFQPLVL